MGDGTAQSGGATEGRAPGGDAFELVSASDRVTAIAAELAAAGRFAFDLEFASAGRYLPELALLQVAWGSAEGPAIALIDCTVVDPRPLLERIADPACTTIGHAVKQDLGLLAARFAVTARGLIDTQIAGALLGLGDQIGYAALVRALFGVTVEKDAQYTEWLRRPLTDQQLRYAAADVRYLLAAWQRLERRAIERGRSSWVAEESAALAASASAVDGEETAYREVRGWRRLDGAGLGALRALAAWRLATARRRNRPLSWVVPDRALIDLCRLRPGDERAMLDIRGVGEGTVRRYGREILEQVAAGAAAPFVEPSPEAPPLGERGKVWAGLLGPLIQARCEAAGVSSHLVANRAEVEALVGWWEGGDRAVEPALRLLEGWRRELCGAPALAWLAGDAAIAAGFDGGPTLRLVICRCAADGPDDP